MDNAAQELVGATFNSRWKLARLIGEGGMGAVYEAHGLHGEGVRAIKVLHPEFVSEDQILNRFFAEAQAVRSLDHPNVAQIFDSARAEDGTPYLVMELLVGAPLSSFFGPGKPMPAPKAAGIMLGVLQALTQAHQRGIVHRDLKPDNLFLVADGRGNHVVKVLDFGIAKVMDAAGGMGSKTKTGVLLGTPGYMSPEQIKNSKGVDPRSDLWSVGVILYEMLTGAEAFPADNEFTRLTLVLTQEIRPIGEVSRELAHWGQFFHRALSKEPTTRFQSAPEMAQALAAMASGAGSNQGRDGGTVALSMPQPPHGGGYPQTSHSPMSAPATAQPHAVQRPTPAPMPPVQQAPASGSYRPPAQVVPVQPQNVALHYSQPPPPPNQGPNTHMSARPAGNTLAQGTRSPSVDVLAPPPVGAPWWVVGAVGFAGLVLGFIAGYLVK
jgi:eukaryotic-like serine/threonine-protein kinase